MKKLVSAFAVCLLAGLVSAADGIASANVVGYTSVGISADTYSMVGVQFEAVGGGSATIQNIFAEPSPGAFKGGAGTGNADNLLVWDPLGGYIYYYFGDWAGEFGAEFDNLWYKDGDDALPTTDVLPPGAAVWFARTGVATTATVAGQVVDTPTVDVPLAADTYTMFSNPFPTPLAFADVTAGGTMNWIASGLTGGTGIGNADNLLVWDPLGGYVYYYFGDWAGEFGTEFDKQWYKDGDDALPTTDSLPIGGATWINHIGAALNLSFPTPL